MTTSREKAVCMIGNTGLRPDLIFPVEIGALLYTSARVLRQVLRARMLGWKRRLLNGSRSGSGCPLAAIDCGVED